MVQSEGLVEDQRKKLLIFTEHKDTLDYLVENLKGDFEVAQIHGRLKLAERIAQERYFRERAQIMVATEAAGEGINLQFCHLMVNYDIPWNPNRLEQRMGRIHRIGQTEDVYVFNLVASNTREGYVLATILRKMQNMGEALGDPVFDVIGKHIRRLPPPGVTRGGPSQARRARSRPRRKWRRGGRSCHQGPCRSSPRPGTRRNYLDWEAERERAERAEERRLRPPTSNASSSKRSTRWAAGSRRRLDAGSLRVTRTPDLLVAASRAAGATVASRRPTSESPSIRPSPPAPAARPMRRRFPQAELCGPGHPLFDALVAHMIGRTGDRRCTGAVLIDPDADTPRALRFLAGDAA